MEECSNELHRALFLHKAWEGVVSEDDDSWIDRQVSAVNGGSQEPFAGIGRALTRILSAGVCRDDITDLVRGMQVDLLFHLCYLLDDPSIDVDGLKDLGWNLVESEDGFEPSNRVITGLHESVLTTDPTGREMRPRTSAARSQSRESNSELG